MAEAYDPYSVESEQIAQRRKYAEMLREQASTALPTQMVGNRAIPLSWTQGLAQGLKGYAGAKGIERADVQRTALAGRQQSDRSSALADALRLGQGTPAQTIQPDEQGMGMAPMQQPAQPGNIGAAYGRLAQAGPQAMQLGAPMLGSMQRSQEADEQRQFRGQEAQLGRDAQAQARQDADQRMREMQSSQQAYGTQQSQAQQAFQQSQAQSQRDFMQQQSREARANRQPQQEQIIQTAQGPMRLVNGQAVPITGPGGAPVKAAQGGRGGAMSATAQKELIETEEQVQGGQAAIELFKRAKEINDKAMGFTGAGMVASAGTLLPNAMRPAAVEYTQELDNVLQSAALPQLKAIFGGMPTEGERKILLDVQGSSSKPPSVRKTIFDRAEKAVQARMKFAGEKAKALREGTYFNGEGMPSLQPQGDPADLMNQADAIIKAGSGRP